MSVNPASSMEMKAHDGVISPPSKESTARGNLLPRRPKASLKRYKVREIVSVLKFWRLAQLDYRRRQLSKPGETSSLESITNQTGGIPSPRAKRETVADLSPNAVNVARGECQLAGRPGARTVIDKPNFSDKDISELDGMSYAAFSLCHIKEKKIVLII